MDVERFASASSNGSRSTSQMALMKPSNCLRLLEQNVFIGAIQCSLLPNVLMFASPCRDLAINMKDRCAFGPGSAVTCQHVPSTHRLINSLLRSANRRGFKIAAQKKRRNRKLDTLVYTFEGMIVPKRSAEKSLMVRKILRSSGGQLKAVARIKDQTSLVLLNSRCQFAS